MIVGRKRLAEPALGAVIINNKISNVCAPGGVETSERICAPPPACSAHAGAGAAELHRRDRLGMPADAMIAALPQAVAALAGGTIMPAAEGIVTTDLVSEDPPRRSPGGGSIVGIAKGAGMIEPNLATMLVYILTDLAVPRGELRPILARAIDASFNAISVDSDTSTSDTVAADLLRPRALATIWGVRTRAAPPCAAISRRTSCATAKACAT
jgi:glutamate N-acetyltransferase/amino-acid N-acetyltransferase